MQWRILADDLTGALDTAAAWSDARTSVPLFLDRPQASDACVQAVSSGSRDLPESTVTSSLAASLDWLCGGERAYKKIDSLLRGNTLAEVAWLLRQGRFRGAVFAPAFPAQGRFTAQLRHWVGAPNEPQQAVRQAVVNDLAQAFAAHGLVVVSGPDMPAKITTEIPVWIPDALHEADLQRLALLAQSPEGAHWLWCGSAGLAQALAAHHRSESTARTPSPECLVTASHHPVLRTQLKQLQETRPELAVSDFMEPQPLSASAAAQALNNRLQAWVNGRPAPRVMAVVGGDTLLALCRCTQATALQAGSSPRPGWGQAHLLNGRWHGTHILTRSGAFGGADDLIGLWPQSNLEACS
jgi:uncharacterized protein YgbK (DUF1537 family)